MKITSRILLIVGAVCGGDIGVASESTRPNIILVMCDDLGWGDVGFNGNTIIQTPHLDEMAAAGLKLNRFYAAAPVCSPTRGSCLTGRHPYRYGVLSANVGHMLDREITLSELLKERGYTTGHFGKWHLGTLTKTVRDANRGGEKGVKHFSPPQDNGFDVCFSTESKVPTFNPLSKPPGAGNKWWRPVPKDQKAVRYGTAYWNENGMQVTENMLGDDSKLIMDRVIPFLSKAIADKKPFFTIIWFHAPHLPVVAGEQHASLYKEFDGYAQQYFGCITALDEQVGRLRSELRNLGVDQDTLVCFCSDNGPEGKARLEGVNGAPGSAGPFRGRKRDLFEGGIRVPAIIEWPARIAKGRQSDYPAVTTDYLPTILELLEIPAPADRELDGHSLMELIDHDVTARNKPIGFQSGKNATVIEDRYKLVSLGGRRAQSASQTLLFDLHNDPSETKNLSDKHPDIVKRMSLWLLEWQRSCQKSLQDGP